MCLPGRVERRPGVTRTERGNSPMIFADLVVRNAALASRPASASTAIRPVSGRAVASGSARRVGRAGPALAVVRHRSGRRGADFSHLGDLTVDEGRDGSGLDETARTIADAARLSASQIQSMWVEAFSRAGGRSATGSSRPAQNRIESQWGRALVKAGLIKAEF
jgi:hypothetical protein